MTIFRFMLLLKRVLNRAGIYASYKRRKGNTTFKIPVFNKLGFANLYDAEPWMLTMFKKTGASESILLDVGANVGQTLLKWKAVWPDAEYIGLEPNTDCVHYINQLILKNNIKKAQILPVALANETQLNYLFKSPTDPSDSTATIIEDFRNKPNQLAMPIVSVPYSVLKRYNFDLIKIDVEGSELDIIRSIFASLENSFPTIMCEILPVYDSKVNPKRLERQQEIERILFAKDYMLFRIQKAEKIKLEPLKEIGIHGDVDASDYIFIHKTKSKEITEKFD